MLIQALPLGDDTCVMAEWQSSSQQNKRKNVLGLNPKYGFHLLAVITMARRNVSNCLEQESNYHRLMRQEVPW